MADTLDIGHLARLSRLELTPEEKEKYATQMGGVLEYVSKLSEAQPGNSDRSVGTEKESNTGIINGVTDAMREDEVTESLPRAEALKNAPAQKDGFIQVKGVFGEDSTESS